LIGRERKTTWLKSEARRRERERERRGAMDYKEREQLYKHRRVPLFYSHLYLDRIIT